MAQTENHSNTLLYTFTTVCNLHGSLISRELFDNSHLSNIIHIDGSEISSHIFEMLIYMELVLAPKIHSSTTVCFLIPTLIRKEKELMKVNTRISM